MAQGTRTEGQAPHNTFPCSLRQQGASGLMPALQRHPGQCGQWPYGCCGSVCPSTTGWHRRGCACSHITRSCLFWLSCGGRRNNNSGSGGKPCKRCHSCSGRCFNSCLSFGGSEPSRRHRARALGGDGGLQAPQEARGWAKLWESSAPCTGLPNAITVEPVVPVGVFVCVAALRRLPPQQLQHRQQAL